MLLVTDHETEDSHKENFVRNEVLATLPPLLFDRLRPHLKLVELRRRAVVNETNKPVDSVNLIKIGVV